MSVTSTLCADVPWLFRSLVYIILHPLTSKHIIRGLKNHRESSACFFNPSPTWRRHTLQSAAGFDLDWTDWIAPQYILTKDITDDFLSRNMVSELKTTGKVSRKRGLSTSGPLHFWFDLIQVYTIRLKLGWMLSLSCSPDWWLSALQAEISKVKVTQTQPTAREPSVLTLWKELMHFIWQCRCWN